MGPLPSPSLKCLPPVAETQEEIFTTLVPALLESNIQEIGTNRKWTWVMIFFHDTSTILLIPVIRGHFWLRINPFLLPTLVLLQSNAPRVASKQFYVYACRSDCHRWNLMGIFSSNKVEVSTYWFEYTLTTFMGVKHFYRASNMLLISNNNNFGQFPQKRYPPEVGRVTNGEKLYAIIIYIFLAS